MKELHADSGAGPGPPLRWRRTIRLAVRAAWDALGLVCAASLTFFLFLPVPAYVAYALGPAGMGAALGAALLLLAPLYAGVCYLTHRVFAHEEAVYLDIWIGFRRLYARAVTLGLIQLLGTAILGANVLFYTARQGFGYLLLSVLFIYLLVFWWMCCQYHFPLLVAAEEGLIPRPEGGPARVSAVLRNGFLLAFSSPVYSLALLVTLIILLTVFIISSVGAALLGAGFAAFLTTRAVRDQLVRFGLLEPEPDPDEPAPPDVWRVGE